MTEQSQKHPADNLALALERASGLLVVLNDLYEIDRERFAGGEAFVAHAISAVAAMVTDAKNALADLHFCCDLALLDQAGDEAVTLDLGQVRDVVVHQDAELPAVDPNPDLVHVHAEQPQEFAQSYLELLNKLTAAEVFAVEQQALAAPGAQPDLLPLLKSLREDIERIHSAA